MKETVAVIAFVIFTIVAAALIMNMTKPTCPQGFEAIYLKYNGWKCLVVGQPL